MPFSEHLLKDFERSFTTGLKAPDKRLRESEWRKSFARARDLLITCERCQRQGFYRPGGTCWKCGTLYARPVELELEGQPVILQVGTQLTPHHLHGLSGDYSTPLAEVTRSPSNPALLGLKNLSGEKWTFTRPDGTTANVPPDRNAPLLSGNLLHFGAVEGKVR